MLDYTDIIVAGIGMVGVVITALIGSKKLLQKEGQLAQAHNEMIFQREAMDFSHYMEEWAGTQAELSRIVETTNIDRFMILRAWNGELTPKWTTAIYQYRSGEQKAVSYVHFELDKDYIDKLRYMIGNGSVSMDVSELDDCYIKQVYDLEGVTQALWFHIETLDRVGTNSKAITYCSFATHDDAPISASTQAECMIFAGRLKGLAHNFAGLPKQK